MQTEVQKPPSRGRSFYFWKEIAVAPYIIAGIWLAIVIAGSAAWILNGGLATISSEAVPVEHDDTDK